MYLYFKTTSSISTVTVFMAGDILRTKVYAWDRRNTWPQCLLVIFNFSGKRNVCFHIKMLLTLITGVNKVVSAIWPWALFHVFCTIWSFGTAKDLGLLKFWTMFIDPHVSEEAVDFTSDILRSNFHFSCYSNDELFPSLLRLCAKSWGLQAIMLVV